MSIWLVGWIAAAVVTGISVLSFEVGRRPMTNCDVLKVAFFSLALWPFLLLVFVYVRLEEGRLGEWLRRPFYKSRSE